MASSGTAIDPLRELLDAVTTRLAALEAHCGITSSAVASSPAKSSGAAPALQKTPSSRHISGDCTFFLLLLLLLQSDDIVLFPVLFYFCVPIIVLIPIV
jgi:hypothetical protein